MHCLNSSRSSALRIASALAPIRTQPCRSSAPFSCRASADVQPGLAPQRRQHGVGLLDGEDLLDDLRRDRLDVRAVGHLGVGHDRGRVGVDQHDLVALLAQGLARLGPRVVELAGLADHDRPGADDQDLVDIGTFGHGGWLSRRAFSGGCRGASAAWSVRGLRHTRVGPRSPRGLHEAARPGNFPIIAPGARGRQGCITIRAVRLGRWAGRSVRLPISVDPGKRPIDRGPRRQLFPRNSDGPPRLLRRLHPAGIIR